eukprot:2877370-Amphidinium_carterae.2
MKRTAEEYRTVTVRRRRVTEEQTQSWPASSSNPCTTQPSSTVTALGSQTPATPAEAPTTEQEWPPHMWSQWPDYDFDDAGRTEAAGSPETNQDVMDQLAA